MKSLFRVALGLMLGVGTASLLVLPADAKKKEASSAGPGLSAAERNAISTLKAALDARDYPAAASALSAAQSVVRSADGRFYLAVMQVEVARGTNNLALLGSTINTLIASGRVSQAELGSLYASQGALAALANDRKAAEAAFSRAMEIAPSADLAITLAQFRIGVNKPAEAVSLIDRAIELRKATGVPVPESWYRRGIILAGEAKLIPQTLKFNRSWIAAYPSPENWRDAVLTYRDNAKPDAATLVDAIRLARLAKGLEGERDYLEAAQVFSAAGLPGEAKSVFDEGVSGRNVDPAKATYKEAIVAAGREAGSAKPKLAGLRSAAAAAPTGAPCLQAADQLLSFGDYAGAIDLYRLALQKGGADSNAANMRLGIALALSGQAAEAEAALRNIVGPRSELAALWLIWLGQRR
jgi:tetratricopeptide (TPR) repeat protein